MLLICETDPLFLPASWRSADIPQSSTNIAVCVVDQVPLNAYNMYLCFLRYATLAFADYERFWEKPLIGALHVLHALLMSRIQLN